MLYVMFDWGSVAVALIAAVPGTIAAIASIRNHRQLRTPSGTTIGKQVESAHHVAIANNYRLQGLGDGLQVPEDAKAAKQEAQAAKLPDEPPEAKKKPNG